MIRIRSITALAAAGLLCAASFAAAQPAQPSRADAEKDPVLKAMLEELDRNMAHLQLSGFAKPFFIQYRVEDVEAFQTKAEFGATEDAERTRERAVRVTVRVGSYKTDSSGGRGDAWLVTMPLDDDPVALRSVLWDATDQAYKNALAAYAQKQAALKQVETPPQADDFSQEKPVVSLAPPAHLELDDAAWTARVARDSGLYRTTPSVRAIEPEVEYSNASFHGRATTTWLVTSEGTIVRKAATEYQEAFGVGAQAADGMSLDRSFSTSGVTVKDLDSPAAFEKHAIEQIASLAELRQAPIVEDEYHGPLLLSADAGTDTLNSLLSDAVIATRPRLGTEARTNGAFASSYQTRVLPEFMNVVDDPGLKTFNGKELLGAYDVDDEGVPAQVVPLVTAGRLVNYLIGRQPVKDFPRSNGHARSAMSAALRPSVGVLKITAQNGLGAEELNRKLMEMGRERGLKNVYYVETLGGALNPRLLYRINSDGSRQLVRGAVLDDIDQRALRSSIVAAGKDLWLANSYGDVPTTVLGPALLLEDATVRRANATNEKLPFYPPPE